MTWQVLVPLSAELDELSTLPESTMRKLGPPLLSRAGGDALKHSSGLAGGAAAEAEEDDEEPITMDGVDQDEPLEAMMS